MVLGARHEVTKERCMERKVKRCKYQREKKVNEQFGRKMNKDIDGIRKLFWREVSKMKGWKVENWSRIKKANGRLALGNE